MSRWRPCGPLLLLLLPLLLLGILPTVRPVGGAATCRQDEVSSDGFSGSLLVSAGNYDPLTLSYASCLSICGDLGNLEAAVEDGQACLCGSGAQLAALAVSTSCTAACPSGGAACGGADGLVTGQPAQLGDAPISLTPPSGAVQLDIATPVTVAGSTTATVAQFVVDPGDGSPPFQLDGTPAAPGPGTEFSASITYARPGNFTVSVSSPSAASSAVVEVRSGVLLAELDCPPLVQPGQAYFCTVTAGGSAVQLTVQFSDEAGAAPARLPVPTGRWLPLGRAPPQGSAPAEVQLAGGELQVTLRQAFSERTLLQSLHWFGAADGACQLMLMQGSCSQADHVFCASIGRCAAYCPLVPASNNHTCAASHPVFCPLSGQCTMGSTCDVTAAPDLVATAVPAVTFNTASAAYGNQAFPPDTWAEPGWFARVSCTTGAVAWSSVPAGQGDQTAAGSDKQYMLELLGLPRAPVGIPHTCAAIGDVELTVGDVDGTTSLASTTLCQVPIEGVAVQVEQGGAALTAEPTQPPAGNFSGAFFVQANIDITLNVTIERGGPVLLEFQFDPSAGVANHSMTIDRAVTPGEVFGHTVQLATSGTFWVRVTGRNNHSDPLQPAHSDLTLTVQYPVTADWQLANTSDSQFLVVVTGTPAPATVVFEMRLASTQQLPTDASMSIDFGDTFSQVLPLSDSSINLMDSTPVSAAVDGNFVARFTYGYETHGFFNVTVTMRNRISEENFIMPVMIEEKIIGLEALVLQNQDDSVDGLQEGMGEDKNQFRNDRYLTFTFRLLQGTMTKVTLFNETSGEELTSYDFKDKNYPTDPSENFTYHIDTNQVANLSFVGENSYQSTIPVPVTVIIQEPITEITHLKLTLGEIQSDDFKRKRVTASWDSASTLMMCGAVQFGDGSPLATFGYEPKCLEKFPAAVNMPTELRNPMEFEFVYRSKGVFNMTFNVFNPEDDETTELMISVSDLPCSNPTLSFGDVSEVREEPTHFLRSQKIVIQGHIELNCDVSLSTKKRWEIFMVSAEETQSTYIMEQLPSWDKADLVIPATFLQPGLHMLLYTITMTGETIPEDEVYQTQARAYIQIDRTPLHAGLIKGGVSKIVRGWNQLVSLDAMTYSRDPDDMPSRDFTFGWYCRRAGEEREEALNATTPAQAVLNRPATTVVQDPDLGGCFGAGPGRLDFEGGKLEVNVGIFRKYNQTATFIVTVLVKKDVRNSLAEVQIEVSDGSPPMIEVECADPILCPPSLEGVTVNPQHDLGLRGSCIGGECSAPLQWLWTISKVSSTGQITATTNTDLYFPSASAQEVRISNTLYTDHPDVHNFHIALEASDGVPGNTRGLAMYFVTVNQPPVVEGKLCTCASTGNTSLAAIDTFYINCKLPIDPEGYPVNAFTFFTTVNDKTVPLAQTKVPRLTTRLPLGENRLHYIVEDQQGASARKEICDISTTQPTEAQMEVFLNSDTVQGTAGTGDSRSAVQISSALASIDATVADGDMTPEQRQAYLVERAKLGATLLEAINNMGTHDKSTIALAAEGVEGITSLGSEDSLKVSLNTVEASVDVLESLTRSMTDANYATPVEMVPTFETIARSISVAADNLARTTRSESCEDIPPSDEHEAPRLPVDNFIDYSKKPEILSLEQQMKCNVRDTARQKSEALVDRMEETMVFLEKETMKRMVLDESLEIQTSSNGRTKLSILTNISGTIDTVGNSTVTWSENMPINDSGPVAVSVQDSPINSRTTVEGAGSVSASSHVLSLNIYTRNFQPVKVANVSGGVTMTISQTQPSGTGQNCSDCQPPPSKINSTEALAGKALPVLYSEVNITKPDSAFSIEFTSYDNDTVEDVFVMVSFGWMPTLRNHSLLKMLKDFPEKQTPNETSGSEMYRWFVSGDLVEGRLGKVFVGIGQFNSSSAKYPDAMAAVNASSRGFDKLKSREILRKEFTMKGYQLLTYTSSCSFYDKEMKRWSGEGLQVMSADQFLVTCNSSHLTSFASGLFVQPNVIDFSYVFAELSFKDNLTIYMTLIVLLTIYFLLLIWAHWQDKKDVEKLGALPLPDNKSTDKYLYEIMLFTGHKADAATDSKVSFVLSGDDYDTGVRTFGKSKRKFFRKGGQDAFVMAVPGSLGDLKYLRIWHDNSGKGRFASWYLQYVLVRNVQTGETTTFVCNEWLAVEYDDGLIDRLVPVAGKEQMRDFSTVFPHTSQQSLSDGHLWFSVFLRPPRSRFTRMQRVSCCFALLFLSMLVNAMWYERVPSTPSAGSIKFGPLSLSPEQIAVGVMSNIIVFVPSLLIVFLFRKSRPRKLRVSRIDRAMQRKSDDKPKERVDSDEKQEGNDDPDTETGSGDEQLVNPTKHGSVPRSKKRRFTIPWWGTIIGWLLCIICLAGSAFIVFLYGIQFGNEKTTKWVTSLFISLFSSILMIQPLKVFLSALVISAIFKNVDLGSDDANEDEQDPELASDEEWITSRPGKQHPNYAGNTGSPYDKDLLEQIRKQRLKEIEMGVIIREIISYAFFLWILFVLSFDNRDPNAFFLQKNLENAFIKVGDRTGQVSWLDFSKVSNTSAFWFWSRNVIMQELRAQTWYDGVTPAYGLRGFLDDRVNRIVGRATMRQVRSKPNTCTIHEGMRSLVHSCQGYSSIVSEDKGSYCANWTRRGSRADCSRVEYRYSSSSKLKSLPRVAKQDVYGGGGYVFQLTGSQLTILEMMTQLENENWIDSLTRAVFIEFSVYNAQVNLFGVATIFVEVTPGGGMHPWWRFDGVRLTKQAGSQAFVIVCEVMYCLFIIYFIVREVRMMRKQKKQYFRQYSIYAEWSIIFLSFAGVIVYIMRFIETDSILAVFKSTYGNGYVRLEYAQALDDLFGYIVGIIVFIATLKFIKLLRFNRRIGMLSATLKQTWGDLTGFLVIFTIAIGSFGLLFNLLLVSNMDDFKDWLSAVESCFAMMLNKFEFMEMYRSNFLAAIMFILFAVYMNLIFVNVLLTIILKGFEQVKSDVTKQPNDYELVDFVVRRFKKFIGINSVTPLKDVLREHQQEQEDGKNVTQLPDKVSQFLDHINHTYFDGNLDLNDKRTLKRTLRQGKHERRGRPKSVADFQRNTAGTSDDQQPLDDI